MEMRVGLNVLREEGYQKKTWLLAARRLFPAEVAIHEYGFEYFLKDLCTDDQNGIFHIFNTTTVILICRILQLTPKRLASRYKSK